MDSTSSVNEPLDLSVTGSNNLRYSLYASQCHVSGLVSSSVWTRPCKQEVLYTKSTGRSSSSPKGTNDHLHQHPVSVKLEPMTQLQGFYPYMPRVVYPMVTPQVPDWISYPSPPEEHNILQVTEAVSLRRPSISPQLGDRVNDDNLSNDPEFQNFRNDAVRAMAERNGGHLVGHNPRMRRTVQSSQEVDDEYRRQRERNNFAAKQSRDRRKLREIESSLKVCFLQRKLEELKALLATNKCGQCHRPCR